MPHFPGNDNSQDKQLQSLELRLQPQHQQHQLTKHLTSSPVPPISTGQTLRSSRQQSLRGGFSIPKSQPNTKTTTMLSEREQQISPIAPDSVIHNTKIISNIHNLTASLFGIGAGILGLESYPGFLFYIFFTLFTTFLLYTLRVAPAPASNYGVNGKGSGRGVADTSAFFQSAVGFWTSGLVDGASGFVLTWTLFYGLVRA